MDGICPFNSQRPNQNVQSVLDQHYLIILFHRWKRDGAGRIVFHHIDPEKRPILEFVAIQRSDTKEWAIPGVSVYSLCPNKNVFICGCKHHCMRDMPDIHKCLTTSTILMHR